MIAIRSRRLDAFACMSIVALASIGSARQSAAQEPMTVTGRVTIGDHPLSGVSIEIPETRLTTRTNAGGWYSFLVPAARVRGQSAIIVARHAQYGRRADTLQLVGGSAIRDFDFAVPAPIDTTSTTLPRVDVVPGASVARWRRSVDSAALGEIAGPVDLASALAGRIAGLQVTSANGPGASAFMMFRGPRSIVASLQPLVVVDGVPVGNSSWATAEQRFGLGGIDYGSPLQDLPLEDIAGVTVLSGAGAAARYGARAANGVIVVTSKRSSEQPGLTISGTVRSSTDSPIRLPAYQNAYGQGLGGRYEFLDGAGGGLNDGVDQSWGPALQGQLVAQASTTQPRQADVRQWLAHPSGVRDYFRDARTLDASAVVQASGSAAGLRLALDARNADGVTPDSHVRRLGVTLNTAAHPTARLSLEADARAVGAQADDRPGTGFDEINAVAGFTRMGRQVDLRQLQQHIVDSASHQINWIYTNRDNPFAQTALNSNTDQRAHVIAGARASYIIGAGLTFDAHAGTDADRDTRDFDVASGWVDGYPTALGRMSFARGGSQRQRLDATETIAGAGLTFARGSAASAAVTVTVGGDYRADSYTVRTAVVDGGSSAISGSAALDSVHAAASSTVAAEYAIAALTVQHTLELSAGLRSESPSFGPRESFPSVNAALTLVHAPKRPEVSIASIRGGWWRAGNAITSRLLSDVYAGTNVTCAPACASPSALDPVLGLTTITRPQTELTDGFEAGPLLTTPGGRLSLQLTGYLERSSNVLLAFADANGITNVAQTGALSNRGVEAMLHAVPLGGIDRSWDITASYSKNTNRVDALGAGVGELPLGPSLFGASLVARTGLPLGTIVGTRYQRADGGALLLTNGLPMPTATDQALGSWQPDWSGCVASSLRIGRIELSGLVDGRFGGHVFSATNLAGSYAGTLEATASRPDGGFVVPGIDAATHAANTIAVSTEDYFHALGAIHEAWVYDASFIKLREIRISYTLPPTSLSVLRDQSARVSLIARNLLTWAKAPNIDPETTLSTSGFQGFEMGQLPSTRSIGLQLSLKP